MPLYEYYCVRCESKFEALRPMSQSDKPAVCPDGHDGAGRVLSVFAALVAGEGGRATAVAEQGVGGCGCGAGGCGCC